ncbi:hypothetical protein Acav_4673 [Paracidovorax avenae ATCC 19860]|uniref:DUF4268 domain-containing protein n=1 Tax=Paracidovorax avenae (strain ATCC 19860 / DSM 7227 / CCUG 15838 / JCM 20985 / LMG 2117 / NCPPB 1011) TaxID=643561 RepID=F0QBT6_PARA1|nr:DUF4268 domain-containing protein [Paracidovorax avenae]ADX48552.1 hypothetical protein Acav_4673 [Paracidovorax avenae ATCC 19860]
MKIPLGKLERIPLRQAWAHEAGEFTPWLAQPDNLLLLAETLGLGELELAGTEHPVGDFKVDILCTDDGGKVIIENQLEKTNHTHLGQILTYAAGVGARKVIWLAESFRTEHVAALEFLNQHTTDELDFFAVEIELWRIGDSPMAPSFNVVVKPNDWAKTGQQNAKAAATTTPTKQRQLKFWTGWQAWLQAKGSTLRTQRPLPQHWTNIALGRTGIHLSATVNSRESRVGMEVYINHDNSKSIFKQLQARQAEIDAALGAHLEWMELPDWHVCRILQVRPASPLENEEQWPASTPGWSRRRCACPRSSGPWSGS